MLEILQDLPENVLGLRAKGRVTADDYRHVVQPAVEAALKKHDKLRLYYEIGAEFEGMDPAAIVEDFEIGLHSLPHWERLAVVSDVRWIRQSVSLFAFMIHGKVGVFSNAEAKIAREWITRD